MRTERLQKSTAVHRGASHLTKLRLSRDSGAWRTLAAMRNDLMLRVRCTFEGVASCAAVEGEVAFRLQWHDCSREVELHVELPLAVMPPLSRLSYCYRC